MYMTEVPNYFLPNAVHVPRIKVFLQALKFVCCCFCVKIEDVLYVKNIVVEFPFTTRKLFSVLHSKKV